MRRRPNYREPALDDSTSDEHTADSEEESDSMSEQAEADTSDEQESVVDNENNDYVDPEAPDFVVVDSDGNHGDNSSWKSQSSEPNSSTSSSIVDDWEAEIDEGPEPDEVLENDEAEGDDEDSDDGDDME